MGREVGSPWRADEIDPAAVAREAAEKAARTRGAVDLAPARYRAVLEPYAIAELLYYSAFDMFNGLALLEERSWFAGRIGERLFDPNVPHWYDYATFFIYLSHFFTTILIVKSITQGASDAPRIRSILSVGSKGFPSRKISISCLSASSCL